MHQSTVECCVCSSCDCRLSSARYTSTPLRFNLTDRSPNRTHHCQTRTYTCPSRRLTPDNPDLAAGTTNTDASASTVQTTATLRSVPNLRGAHLAPFPGPSTTRPNPHGPCHIGIPPCVVVVIASCINTNRSVIAAAVTAVTATRLVEPTFAMLTLAAAEPIRGHPH